MFVLMAIAEEAGIDIGMATLF